jgi:hypothetical protein
MAEQLTITGGSVSHPPPRARHLTERQRELLRMLRVWGEVSTRAARLYYADPSGALGRLEALGLVERVGRGRWRAR